MHKSFYMNSIWRGWLYRRIALSVMVAILGACEATPISFSDTPSALDTHGPGAAKIASLWWLMLGLGTFIFILVTVLLMAALLRRRRASSDTMPDSNGDIGRHWLIWGGIVMPLMILAIVFGYNIYTLVALTNPAEPEVSIHVVGRRWWWEVNYPAEGISTANEIHIPVGAPIQLQLDSADVIHSFWVPQLHGKMDAMPTRVNTLNIQADEIGVYRGQCAEYCGLQHAHMGFVVVVESNEDYDSWVKTQQQSAEAPVDETTMRGQTVFLESGCAFCHTVRGLNDTEVDKSEVDLGPDLTHLNSRMLIAGATLTNNRGNLAGWIIDAQHVKPGALMPTMYLPSEDLQALLAYLETLN